MEGERGDPSPDLAAVARRMRAQWRAEEEQEIRDAAEQFRHGRSLADVCADAAMRGDIVAISIAGHRLVGPVIAVAEQIVSLDVDGCRADVVVGPERAVVVETVRARAVSGRSRPRERMSLRSRLLEHEMARARAVVGVLVDGAVHDGRVQVGADHVVVDDGVHRIVCTLAAIAWVAATRPSDPR